MALVIGLVAAAARAISNHDHDRQHYSSSNPGYDSRYYNNNGYSSNSYNASPYAAYPSQMTGSRRACRRMNRKMRKAEREAREADMVMAFMGSGSRASPRSAMLVPPQHVDGGVPYMRHSDNLGARAMHPLESQGVTAGSHTSHMPPGPEGYQWRDAQSHARPASRGDRHAGFTSTEGLPTYEQVVRRSGKP
ncbi:hypothetical protein TARUN_583 [Trichoderma arundinaceum]|uniref:Uncharacterized protein n=1 Tax=Trichoderma arundinaceum TaxID=490622 RepID=A0A395NZV1_TRIAR|nr:hypothetical protein TARUN_583 [Trichoderma arundinaceum]